MKIATFAAFLILIGMAPAQSPIVPGAHHDPKGSGSVLLTELSCTACHQPADKTLQPKGGPDLMMVAERVQPDYLRAFIADPAATKPGTTMPHVLHGLGEEERADAAKAIADYLTSLSGGRVELTAIDSKAIERGRTSFHRIGCAACHSAEEKTLPNSPPLHRLEEKYSLSSLTAFLEDPLAVRPSGRMPDLGLTHFEAEDIASFLLRDQKKKPLSTPARRVTRAAEGKALFNKHGCAQCHAPGETKADFATALSALPKNKACSSAKLPLSAAQQTAIDTALQSPPKVHHSQLTLQRLNCYACHERDGIGGVPADRQPYFTTANINLGNQARIPPSLTHVGAKLEPTWLRKVLVSGASVRPYMHTRMPKFGVANVEPLLDAFAELDQLPPTPPYEAVKDQKIARTAGHELAGSKNLSCVACHTWKGESATTLKGVELTTMAERIQVDWFHQYMREPQKFHPTTIMPSFWPGGKAVRPEVLEGDTGQQIDALWQYLQRGREARTPQGIKREPIEYGATDSEAVILRRQYNGIGKRGIGVGYPSRINIAFDALQLRLGSIWAGEFAEMSSVWRGQGSGNVNERSRDVVRFATGPALAVLETPEAAWPDLEKGVRPDGYQFKGYSVDPHQRPTFRYQYAGITFSDRFIDAADGPSLTRTITLDKAAPENLYLRIAADKEVKATDGENTYQLPRKLTVTTNGATLRKAGELTELVLALKGRKEIVITYRFAP